MMDGRKCKELFYRLVYPSHPNEWEIDEVMDQVGSLKKTHQELLFAQVQAIWPVSHSLCLAFLEDGAQQIENVPKHLVPEWVRSVLTRYETAGLAGARDIITNVGETFLEPLKSHNRVSFEQISARMAFYGRGLSGLPLELAPHPIPHTDTRTIYVPPVLSFFQEREQNVLLYKFLVTLHYGFIRQGTFRCDPVGTIPEAMQPGWASRQVGDGQPLMNLYFGLFPDPLLAADLFFVSELNRVMSWISEELPGLKRQVDELYGSLEKESAVTEQSQITRRVSRFTSACMFESPELSVEGFEEERLRIVSGNGLSAASDLPRIYERFSGFSGRYRRPLLLELLGVHDFLRAAVEIERRREEVKDLFVMQLAHLLEANHQEAAPEPAAGGSGEDDGASIVLTESVNEAGHHDKALLIDNEGVQIPDDLQELIQEIENDVGIVPKSYFSAAAGIAGGGLSQGGAPESSAGRQNGSGAILYDEWDYRRNGYRKGWCRVYEKEIPLLRSNFVPATLEKHRGLLTRIRRQFEMMRFSEHFVGRQRDGDDFDIDAIVEACADRRAGVMASDQLFVRLLRNDRDIVTLFLVDMSNSTEGWVGTVIKESLVLLCEAMETIGDSYGIYGFSGMRRTRCEMFPIKHPAEPFNTTVPQKIGSIMPREYTRLGPAIRHAVDLLGRCEARTRLLVTITDGKPEDYDDYKGDYAIEDTRKALMEARGNGLQTFCITVDRQAHDYLPHMYGSGNYVFVDDIKKLPSRMIEMYRLLTA